MSKQFKYTAYILTGLFLLCVSYSCGQGSVSTDLPTVEKTHQQIELVNNEEKILTELLADEKYNGALLLEELNMLKAKPSEVEYVVRTETVLLTQEKIVYKVLPHSYTYESNNKLVYGTFNVSDDGYEFETAVINITGNLVITDDKSALSLIASSSLSELEVELPVSMTVSNVKPKLSLFEPNILVGGSTSIGATIIPRVGFSAATTLFHPKNNIDLLGIRVGMANTHPELGIDIGYVNVADKIPILTNAWIGLGATYSHSGAAGTLTLAAKL